jgi:hypothetical protein
MQLCFVYDKYLTPNLISAPHSIKLHWLMELSSNFHGVSYLDVALGCGNYYSKFSVHVCKNICDYLLDCRVMKAV